jgi:hypothetical protein
MLWAGARSGGGVVTCGCFTDLMPIRGQRFYENVPDKRLIFYNQNTHGQVSSRGLPKPHQGNDDLLSFGG